MIKKLDYSKFDKLLSDKPYYSELKTFLQTDHSVPEVYNDGKYTKMLFDIFEGKKLLVADSGSNNLQIAAENSSGGYSATRLKSSKLIEYISVYFQTKRMTY